MGDVFRNNQIETTCAKKQQGVPLPDECGAVIYDTTSSTSDIIVADLDDLDNPAMSRLEVRGFPNPGIQFTPVTPPGKLQFPSAIGGGDFTEVTYAYMATPYGGSTP